MKSPQSLPAALSFIPVLLPLGYVILYILLIIVSLTDNVKNIGLKPEEKEKYKERPNLIDRLTCDP